MRVLQNQVHLRPIVPFVLREASQERTTITDTAGSHAPSHSQVEPRRSDNADEGGDSCEIKRNACGFRVGETHHRAKLTDAQVAEIRRLYGSEKGMTYTRLAVRFGAGMATIRDIVLYRTRL